MFEKRVIKTNSDLIRGIEGLSGMLARAATGHKIPYNVSDVHSELTAAANQLIDRLENLKVKADIDLKKVTAPKPKKKGEKTEESA